MARTAGVGAVNTTPPGSRVGGLLSTGRSGLLAGPVGRGRLAHVSTPPPTPGPLQQLRTGRLPRRLVQLYAGLALYGFSMAMVLRADLGLDPWDVLHQGLAEQLGWSFGTVVIVVGALVLLLWAPLRQRPGLGTVSNVVVIGLTVDAGLAVLPPVESLPLRVGLLLGGVVLNGLAGATYLASEFGAGPRDGLMTGLVARTGRSVRLVRTCLEVTVLGVGLLLGGTVGIGTVLYAVAIGPLVQLFLPLVAVRRRTASQRPRSTRPHWIPLRPPAGAPAGPPGSG